MAVESASGSSLVRALLPLTVAVLLAFLTIGLALPVLPIYVRDGLGFGPLMVGVVTGCQFGAALLVRVWAGRSADVRGAKWAVIAGFVGMSVAGALYLLSSRLAQSASVSVVVLLSGRAVLGAAESLVITGAVAWGLARVGSEAAGKVIAWMGTAMFAGLAVGAPLGTALYEVGGFSAIAAVTTIAPAGTLAILQRVRGSPVTSATRPSIGSIFGRIWLPGLGAALSSVGYGAILSFGALLFSERSWTPVWLSFSAYAAALIVARIFMGHLPDRFGGARVAVGFVVVEAVGLGVMWIAPSEVVAALGAALTGLGYSLVFPGLGVEAVRLAPPESRGVAMGAYTACLDLALGLTGPGLGLIASVANYGAVFAVSALVVLCAAGVSLALLTQHPRSSGTIRPSARV